MKKRNLVFVHGRAQENKDAALLKAEWIQALEDGLSAVDRTLPIAANDIRFPYYGQALYDLARDVPEGSEAQVIMKGAGKAKQELSFARQVIEEVARQRGITEVEIQAELDEDVLNKGMLNDTRVLAILKALDRHIPRASVTSIAMVTHDVYRYLNSIGVRDTIENGVRAALSPDVASIVVAHSLGTIVIYNLLRREGAAAGWQVPLMITLGSPLGVTAIKKSLTPIGHPANVKTWFNARDPLDTVALYPLDTAVFPIKPSIENRNEVANTTPNHHGITGYLRDPVVALRIHEALTAND